LQLQELLLEQELPEQERLLLALQREVAGHRLQVQEFQLSCSD
jgi:hypothetical protein